MSEAATFRILSLNGGGLRGAYGASLLSCIEKQVGVRIVDHFDLIVGTSTGGLLALGLALGQPASELLRFYVEDGPRIFEQSWWPYRCLRQLLFSKYSAAPLELAVKRVFGDTTLGEARTRVVVPAFDADAGKPVCFKTRHNAALRVDHTRNVWEIAMATSAAPTYLPPFEASWRTRYIDGGVWANCPLDIAILEAIRFLGVAPKTIQVLSVGTTWNGYRLGSLPRSGRLPWVRKGRIFELLMAASESASAFKAGFMIPQSQILTVNDQTATAINMDEPRWIAEMCGRGDQAAKQHSVEIQKRFLSSKVVPFVPVLMESPTTGE